MVKEDGLPLGLGFGLAMNEDAMRGFSSLDDDEKKQVIDAAKHWFQGRNATVCKQYCGNWKNKISG